MIGVGRFPADRTCKRKSRGFILGVLACLLGTTCAGSSLADERKLINLSGGTLECRIGPKVGMLVFSVRSVSCRYILASGASVGKFTGSLSNVGLDVGVTGGRTAMWRISGAPSAVALERLSGGYAGTNGVRLLRHSARDLRLELVSLTEEAGLGLSVGQLEMQIYMSN